MNTAIVITVITPFTLTIAEGGLIQQIYAIFFAEIFTTNIIQLTDPWGHFQRHVLAPRAATQDTMNLCFLGLEVELAERYTNVTKIMFLAFWYSSIFPGALFLCSLALLTNYYTDRFSLMRTWKRAPHVSTEISTYSRNYFFTSACVFLAVMSNFYWSAFPFDNLCKMENTTVDEDLYGNYTLNITKNDFFFGSEQEFEYAIVNATSYAYRFCPQDYLLGMGWPQFPFFYGKGPDGGAWMSDEQQNLSFLFGWTAVGVLCLTGAKFIMYGMTWLRNQFYAEYDVSRLTTSASSRFICPRCVSQNCSFVRPTGAG